MAEQYPQGHADNNSAVPPPEAKERGSFNFMKKDKNEDEKTKVEVVMADLDAANGSQDGQKLHTHSSSSGEDEVDAGGERRKKKKKKGLKEAITDKISGDNGEDNEHKDTTIPADKCNEEPGTETTNIEERKGFLEKIKEKLPGHGQQKKTEHATETQDANEKSTGGESKGIMETIKEKLPGHHNIKED